MDFEVRLKPHADMASLLKQAKRQWGSLLQPPFYTGVRLQPHVSQRKQGRGKTINFRQHIRLDDLMHIPIR